MSSLVRRGVPLACVAVSALVATTCVRDSTVSCADGWACPAGLTCLVRADRAHATCVTESQLVACTFLAEGMACELDGEPGTCLAGACFVPVCGDGVIDTPERCDDMNTSDGDGCSARCNSDETCGNGVVDAIRGEQCDEGTVGLAGDGCSNQCKSEYRVWRDVTPGGPSLRSAYGLATDPIEGVLLFGGAPGGYAPLAGGSAVATTPLGDTWRWTGATWLPVATPNGPPALQRVAMSYDPARKRVVMFGGMNATGARTDQTWEWDGYRWLERVVAPAPDPSARSDASLACAPMKCVLHSGVSGVGKGGTNYRSDTWMWDGTAWTPINAGSSAPSGRGRAAMTAHMGTILLFGGEAGALQSAFLRDTWELDTQSRWRLVENGTPPVPTNVHPASLAVEEATSNVILTSGFASGSPTWVRSGDSWTDTSRSLPTGTGWLMAVDRRRSTITAIGQGVDEMIAADLQATSWSPTAAVSPQPGNRTLSSTYDTRRGRAIILDRQGGTFEWDGIGWRRSVIASSGPTPTVGNALAYDARCGVTLAFGGAPTFGGVPVSQMWSYDGTQWTQVATALPPAVIGHAMVYDAAHDAVVLFGGRTGTSGNSAFSDELWIWSGATCATRAWSRITVTGPWPSGRLNAKLGYDERRGRVLLFGGTEMTGDTLGDTWELDGSTWTWGERSPATRPEARTDHAIAYDPRRKRLVMFGGRSGSRLADSWEWDGDAGTWLALATVLAPSPRAGHTMTIDITGSIIAVGGENGGTQVPVGPFRLRNELSLEPPDTCFDESDTDGDNLAGCADPDCSLRCATCGDGVCSVAENYLLCPADCPAQSQ